MDRWIPSTASGGRPFGHRAGGGGLFGGAAFRGRAGDPIRVGRSLQENGNHSHRHLGVVGERESVQLIVNERLSPASFRGRNRYRQLS